MRIRFTARNGKTYDLETDEVQVLTPGGSVVAVAYTEDGAILHSNANQSDWSEVAKRLGFNRVPVERVDQ